MATRSPLDTLRVPPPDRGVTVCWLGQSGVVIRGRSGTVVVDPFLTDHGSFGRTYPPSIAPADLSFADVVIGTHDHVDHIDPEGFPAMLAASSGAVGVVPAAVLDRVARLGVDRARLVGAEVGRAIDAGGVRLEPIAAVHAPTPQDGYGFHLDSAGCHPFLGFAIELDGVRICHTGDTFIYDGLAERLRELDLDLLLLPINGVSWFREQRGLAGNMNAFEAAELAELAGARLTVPMHWDLFADNTADPHEFERYAARRHPGARTMVAERDLPFHVEPVASGA